MNVPKHNQLQLLFHILLPCICRNKYAHEIGHVCHMYQIFVLLKWKMYTHVCAISEVIAINYVTWYIIHIFQPLCYKDLETLHICKNMYTKIQPAVMSTSHFIVKYVSERNIPTKLRIYIIYVQYLM